MHVIRIFLTLLFIATTVVPGNTAQQSWINTLTQLFSSKPSLDDVPGVRHLAAKGHPKAQYMLYVAYRDVPRKGAGPEISNDQLVSREEAEAGLRAAAEQGFFEAVGSLGLALHLGRSVRRDSRAAIPWIEKLYAGSTAQEKNLAAYLLGDALRSTKNATAEETARGIKLLDEAISNGVNFAVRSRARAMIKAGDKTGARRYLEAEVKKKNIKAYAAYARMLIEGTGGPADIDRGLELLNFAHAAKDSYAGLELAHEHLDGGHLLPNPSKALELMAPHAEEHFETRQELAILLPGHIIRLANAEILFLRMKEDEQLKEPEAAWNLLRMLDERQEDFRDDTYLRELVGRHQNSDQRIELWQAKIDAFFSKSSSSSDIFAVSARKIIDKLIAKKLPAAFTLKGMLLLKGRVYPQNSVASTQALLKGAQLGDREAMIELAEAYDDGIGLARDPVENLKWLRNAAALGSIDAKRTIIGNFSRNENITLREGLTQVIALYGDTTDGIGSALSIRTLFSTTNFTQYTQSEVAAAFMDGFRASSAAAQGDSILFLQRTVPKRVWALVEKVLMADGFFKGPPEGYLGPDARAALNKWIISKGRLSPLSEAIAANKRRLASLQIVETPIYDDEAKRKNRTFVEFGNSEFKAKKYKAAMRWYKLGAELGGDHYHLYQIAWMHQEGLGVKKDYSKAAVWYKKAADQGNVAAMHKLALMYWNGIGVSKDLKKSFQLILKSAEGGFPESMHALATFYEDGKGVAKDENAAKKWSQKAAEAGSSDAMYTLAASYYHGDGVERDYPVALKWFERAAMKGHADSMYWAGIMNINGFGVEPNLTKAARFIARSINAGSETAFDQVTKQWNEFDKKFRIAFQGVLNYQGLYTGPEDGALNPQTNTAIKKLAGKS